MSNRKKFGAGLIFVYSLATSLFIEKINNPPDAEPPPVRYSTFIDSLRTGNVSELIINGRNLNATTKDNQQFTTTLPNENTVYDLEEKQPKWFENVGISYVSTAENIKNTFNEFAKIDLKILFLSILSLTAFNYANRKNYETLKDSLSRLFNKPKISLEDEKTVAYHEAGHALISSLLPIAGRIQKATIIHNSNEMGYVSYIREASLTREILLNLITCDLAGRAAEIVVFGKNKMNVGSANDLKHAKFSAEHFVLSLGFSDEIGPINFSENTENGNSPFKLSDTLHKKIEGEIERILKQAEARAIDLIQKNRPALEAITQELLKHKTLTGEHIEQIVAYHTKTVPSNTAQKLQA